MKYLIFVLLLVLPGIASADPCARGEAGAMLKSGDGSGSIYVSGLDNIKPGTQFRIEVTLCDEDPNATLTLVDAQMPAHGHGMNYAPTLERQASGTYDIEGLLMHMAGAWEFTFKTNGASGFRTFTHPVTVTP